MSRKTISSGTFVVGRGIRVERVIPVTVITAITVQVARGVAEDMAFLTTTGCARGIGRSSDMPGDCWRGDAGV